MQQPKKAHPDYLSSYGHTSAREVFNANQMQHTLLQRLPPIVTARPGKSRLRHSCSQKTAMMTSTTESKLAARVH